MTRNAKYRAVFAPLAVLAPILTGTAALAQAPVDVKVYFDQGCPKYVDLWTVEVENNPPQRVRWTAFNITGSEQDKNATYAIYFDPFVGPGNTDPNEDGVITSKPVSDKVPDDVDFKYSVVAPGCPALDPIIRVR
jgi:hypothetical protein